MNLARKTSGRRACQEAVNSRARRRLRADLSSAAAACTVRTGLGTVLGDASCLHGFLASERYTPAPPRTDFATDEEGTCVAGREAMKSVDRATGNAGQPDPTPIRCSRRIRSSSRWICFSAVVRPTVRSTHTACQISLAESHEIRVACALRHLPWQPLRDYGIERMIREAKADVAATIHEDVGEWRPPAEHHSSRVVRVCRKDRRPLVQDRLLFAMGLLGPPYAAARRPTNV